MVGGITVNALCDTGASAVLIDPRIVKELDDYSSKEDCNRVR
ncbi:MAG: hypothetical protein GY928_26070 [Colwellia sp.]|nr:hypothetical protein [Colwellia sp.]